MPDHVTNRSGQWSKTDGTIRSHLHPGCWTAKVLLVQFKVMQLGGRGLVSAAGTGAGSPHTSKMQRDNWPGSFRHPSWEIARNREGGVLVLEEECKGM